MALVDCRGLSHTTTDRRLLNTYEKAVDLSASYFLDPLAVIQGALDEDPTFAAGHCLRAGLAIMSTDRSALPLLEQSIDALEALGRRANDRERAHAAAARAWLQGDFASCIERYGAILWDHPHDLLALQIAHIGDFFLGASTLLRDRIAQVLPLWDTSIPGFNYVLGMHAFGLEETGLYSRAEDVGRRALELEPRDPWAVHAVTHVMEMQGRLRDGIEWLSARENDWAPNNGFAFHNWWHLALYHMDMGDTAQVLKLYDTRIRASASQVPLEMIDASALLWRMHIRGEDVGPRWQALSDSWQPSSQDAYYAFNDVHAVMASIGAQQFDRAALTLSAMEAAAGQSGTNSKMTREVGLPVAHALMSFGMRRYAECVDLLLPVRPIANRFGGSHAQRDVIHLTLIEAALRAGKLSLARALVSERTQLKPSSPFNWQLNARVHDSRGDAVNALKSRESADTRRRAQLGAYRAA